MNKIQQDLLIALRDSFERLRIPYMEAVQKNRFVYSTGFKKNTRAVYCYILHEDYTRANPPANIVFRFRKNEEIRLWFREQRIHVMVERWRDRFERMWSKGGQLSKAMQDPEMVTAQYGIFISEDEIEDADFENTLDRFLLIAVEAVNQASRRRNRDWSVYESMTR